MKKEAAMTYKPRFTVTAKILNDVMRITEILTRNGLSRAGTGLPHLRRVNRLRSLHSSLSIEGNSLSLDDVSAIIDGRIVKAPRDEIQEVLNSHDAYESMDSFDPFRVEDLLNAHGIMINGLIGNAGSFRTEDEGIFDKDGNCVHIAPNPKFVPTMMENLLEWTRTSDYPMIIRSCVFHYEFEYIHPFEDGNGRIGRLWQTLLLSKYDESFKWIPIESLIRVHQKRYYDAITISNESSDCTAFVEFMTGAILEALMESTEAIDRREICIDGWIPPNEVSLYALIRDGYYRNIEQAAEQIGVSRPTLNRYLKSLKDKGLIEKIGNKRSGTWVILK